MGKLRITNCELRMGVQISEFPIRSSQFVIRNFLIALVLSISLPLHAQQFHIAAVRPDEAAPGMTVVVQILSRIDAPRPFGFDGLFPAGDSLQFIDARDSERIVTGPFQVSWNGRMIEIPLFVMPGALPGPVAFRFFSPATGWTDTGVFRIVAPQHIPRIIRDTVLASLSSGNTIVVDSLVVQGVSLSFSLQDPDLNVPGNPRLQPVIVLSNGPVLIVNGKISLDANVVNGGPGGGGGGHGYTGTGGFGYTGGGNADTIPGPDIGSGTNATSTAGGYSITGVPGGGSITGDQGGGGGTGMPFGASGGSGLAKLDSQPGGDGGGSGGGETSSSSLAYGGGGGGFGGDGSQGGGFGDNSGKQNGGRFLIPLAGGSGGGSGNSIGETPGAGSGGGGGGAIEIVSYDSIIANASSLTANGDSGTTGALHTAGGGGGSGGAIYLASSRGIKTIGSQILANGGRGGLGSDNSGGDGSLGRIRIDGAFDSSQMAGIAAEGISVFPIRSIQRQSYCQVMGISADTDNTLDTIRVYYRTRHTRWQYFDTVRYRSGGRMVWSKWLPLYHDSLLFVEAMVEVANPSTDNANLEPGWIMSHVGMTVVHHTASPFLIAAGALDFGQVRINHCETEWLKISNDGEIPLTIDSFTFAGSPAMTSLTNLPKTIPPYSIDSIELRFCPDSLGITTATVTVHSNDSDKHVVLTGIGIERKDSLLVRPASLDFGRILLGRCASDTVSLYSIGTDTVYLNFTHEILNPFTFDLIGHDSALAPRDSARLAITFCPSDTGNVHIAPSIDTREDSIPVSGYGIVRILASEGRRNLGTICANAIIQFSDSIINYGNDTISIRSVSSSAHNTRLLSPLLPQIIQPHDTIAFSWQLSVAKPGAYMDTLYYHASDTTLSTIVAYTVVQPLLDVDSSLAFQFLCVNNAETSAITIRNTSPDTVRIVNVSLVHGLAFTLLDTISQLASGDSGEILIQFQPRSAGDWTDTLLITASVAGCDSEYAVSLSGAGTTMRLVAEPLDFDTVMVGECKEDSLLIQNPCGPDIVIDSVILNDTIFRYIGPALPLIVRSGNESELHFRYCPRDTSISEDTILLVDSLHNTYATTLRGVGRPLVNPWAHFTITDAIIISGDSASVNLRLDSTSLAGFHKFDATVSYDPEVVSFLGEGPFPSVQTAPGSFNFSGVLNFNQAQQFVASISWLGLLGPRSSTQVSLTFAVDTPLNVIVAPGLVTVTDCSNLSGHVSVAGPYHLGQIAPDPIWEMAEPQVQIDLGNDGYVEAEVYDVTGRIEEQVLARSLERGSYWVTIPISTLSAGRHFFVIHSLGWREVRPFLIIR